jgi:hypothetical protein
VTCAAGNTCQLERCWLLLQAWVARTLQQSKLYDMPCPLHASASQNCCPSIPANQRGFCQYLQEETVSVFCFGQTVVDAARLEWQARAACGPQKSTLYMRPCHANESACECRCPSTPTDHVLHSLSVERTGYDTGSFSPRFCLV